MLSIAPQPRDINAANSLARLGARERGLWVTTLALKGVRLCFPAIEREPRTHILCPNRLGGCYKVSHATESEIYDRQPQKRVKGLAPNQKKYRILVADDESANRLLLTQILKSAGFVVWFADNGIEAVKLWRKYKPHLIWMDLRMPVLDGFQAAQQIRSLPDGSNTNIIALSANAFVKTQELAMSKGFDDFVAKPFREAVIFEKMARPLGVRYIYQEEASRKSEQDEPVMQLTSESLSVLPRESIEKLYKAAACGDEQAVRLLIERIPLSQKQIAAALTKLVDNMSLDIISDLTQH